MSKSAICISCGGPKPPNTRPRCLPCQTAHMRAANEAFRAQCEANPHSWVRATLPPPQPPPPPPPLVRPVQPQPRPPARDGQAKARKAAPAKQKGKRGK